MTDTTKTLLAAIDTVLASDDEQSAREVWDVLSALRGPDTHNYKGKTTATIPIRRAAFPLTTVRFDRWTQLAVTDISNPTGTGGRASFGNPGMSCIAAPLWETMGHFEAHARKAARVLGLID